jgi:AcrR family transcriptional regulator
VAPGSGAEAAEERERICDSLIELTAERGYPGFGLEALQERAGVTHAAYRAHFSDLQACATHVWVAINAELIDRMTTAFESPENWRDQLRAALDAGLRFLGADVGVARLYASNSVWVDDFPGVRRPRGEVERLGAMIDLGRSERDDPEMPAPLVAELTAGGIWFRVRRLIREGREGELLADLPQLMYFAVLPHLGPGPARRELPDRH